nr:unnamed protein product [Callosobruchus chinensis]
MEKCETQSLENSHYDVSTDVEIEDVAAFSEPLRTHTPVNSPVPAQHIQSSVNNQALSKWS